MKGHRRFSVTDVSLWFALGFCLLAVIQGNLRQEAGKFSITVLVGPSGCGKTTILRCLAGLERPESGAIRWGEAIWFDSKQRVFRSPQQRDIGYLFQEYALFPHLTVAENVGYGLGSSTALERRHRVAEMLDLFGLSELEHRYPHQVSGGQQQRIALARVLVRRPRLLLLETVVMGRVVEVREGLATVVVGPVELVAVAPVELSGEAFVCVRAEEVVLQRGQAGPSSPRNRLEARVTSIVPEGPLVRVGLDCGFSLTALVTRPASEELGLRPGDTVTALLKVPAIHLIPRGYRPVIVTYAVLGLLLAVGFICISRAVEVPRIKVDQESGAIGNPVRRPFRQGEASA